MFPRFSFALAILLLPLQAIAADGDFVFSSEPTQTVIGGGEAPPVVETQSYGGNRPSDTPDVGGSQQQQVKKEHPKPELPAGWTAPEDVTIGTTNPFTTGMFSGNGLVGGGFSGGALNSGAALSQIQQLMQAAQAPGSNGVTAPRVAGNLAISAFASPGTSYSRGTFNVASASNIMNSPLGMAAALSGGDDDGPSSAQDRAMMVAYFQQLLQYVQSQPNNPSFGIAGNGSGGYNAQNLYGTATANRVVTGLARGVSTGGITSSATGSTNGGTTALRPIAFR